MCCAQQTGIGHVIVEALLGLAISEGQPPPYRHKKTSAAVCLTCPMYPCPAESMYPYS